MYKPTGYYRDQYGTHPVFEHLEGPLGIGVANPHYKLSIPLTSSDFRFGSYEDATHFGSILPYQWSDGAFVFNHDHASTGGYDFQFEGNSQLYIKINGNVGIGTAEPTEKLDVNADAIRVRTPQTPASAGATGTEGMICWDSDYIYVCVATNTWKRVLIETW